MLGEVKGSRDVKIQFFQFAIKEAARWVHRGTEQCLQETGSLQRLGEGWKAEPAWCFSVPAHHTWLRLSALTFRLMSSVSDTSFQAPSPCLCHCSLNWPLIVILNWTHILLARVPCAWDACSISTQIGCPLFRITQCFPQHRLSGHLLFLMACLYFQI